MKNKVQFQKGYSLSEFMKAYGTEEKYQSALFQWRWPNGYLCPKCGSSKYYTLKSRAIFQCHHCHHQHALTSGTVFASTKRPLTTWFLAIHLLTQAKTGLSALAVHRQLGVNYNTAWSMKQKIMPVMKERDESQPLSGRIPLDDVDWGGEQHGGNKGRGSGHKTPFVAAVSVDEQGHPLRMNMTVVKGFRSSQIRQWGKRHLQPGAQVVSDGLNCFKALSQVGFEQTAIVTGGGAASMACERFTWVNTLIGNVKNAMTGAYHAINPKHLLRYLAEFC